MNTARKWFLAALLTVALGALAVLAFVKSTDDMDARQEPRSVLLGRCGKAIIGDWFDNGRVDLRYEPGCYAAALNRLGGEADPEIERRLAAAITRAHNAASAQMATVPHVTQTNVVRAYDLLRAAGLRVAIRNRFSADSLCLPIAQNQSPRPGTASTAGSVVTISAGSCPLASPGVAKPMPTAKVPSFHGKLASAVVTWAERSRMFWAVRDLTPLSASDAPHLLDNYRVVRQRPLPGATLRPGVTVGGKFPGFRPTPITVWVEPR